MWRRSKRQLRFMPQTTLEMCGPIIGSGGGGLGVGGVLAAWSEVDLQLVSDMLSSSTKNRELGNREETY